jgi:hypothetical protein
MTTIRVYVAGPYSADNVMDVLGNIRKGIAVCRDLLLVGGYAPYCPWLDYLYVITADQSEFDQMDKSLFQAASLAWVDVCDCMLVISPRISDGVLREMNRAKELGIPVFGNITDMEAWRLGIDP